MNGIERAVFIAGGQHALARALGLTQPAVRNWVRQGWVPAKRLVDVERVTGVRPFHLAHPDVRAAMLENEL